MYLSASPTGDLAETCARLVRPGSLDFAKNLTSCSSFLSVDMPLLSDYLCSSRAKLELLPGTASMPGGREDGSVPPLVAVGRCRVWSHSASPLPQNMLSKERHQAPTGPTPRSRTMPNESFESHTSKPVREKNTQ
jgi:hypothetical protein